MRLLCSGRNAAAFLTERIEKIAQKYIEKNSRMPAVKRPEKVSKKVSEKVLTREGRCAILTKLLQESNT